MTSNTVTPQRTYALVVGIEKYNAGVLWNLDGPANDARNFASWLRSKEVPSENIFLFLSPLDKNTSSNLVSQGFIEEEALLYKFYHMITDKLPDKDGDLLYIFWGGHGMITAEGERRLFYADATQMNLCNLNLNSLLGFLRSNLLKSFERQIFIIDSCAKYYNPPLPIVTDATFPSGPPRKRCEQFVLFAAKTGEVAKNISTEQTGLFSKAVMEELRREVDGSWPPSMEKLAKNLECQFEELRQAGKAQQTPTYFWIRDWNGNENSQGSVSVEQAVNKSITWRCLPPLNEHSGSVKAIAISPNGQLFASGSQDKTIKIWNLTTGKLHATIKASIVIVKYIVFSPDGQTLVSCGKFETGDNNVKLWDVSTGKLKTTLGRGLASSGIFSYSISPDGEILAIGQVGVVKIWSLFAEKELNTLKADGFQSINSLSFSADGQILVAGCSRGDIKIWDWRNQRLLSSINQSLNPIDFVKSLISQSLNPIDFVKSLLWKEKVLWFVAISHDGKIIASAGEELPLTLWNFDPQKNPTKWHTSLNLEANVRCVAFSPNGQLLASGSQDKTVRLWDIHTGDLLYTFNLLAGEINCVAFSPKHESPDHETLVSADDVGIIKIWHKEEK